MFPLAPARTYSKMFFWRIWCNNLRETHLEHRVFQQKVFGFQMAEDIFPYLIDLELMWQGEGEVSWLNSNKFRSPSIHSNQIRIEIFSKIVVNNNITLMNYTEGRFFSPEKCLKEFILTWWTCFENAILVQIVFRIWTKIADSHYWKVDQNRILTRDPDQKCHFGEN